MLDRRRFTFGALLAAVAAPAVASDRRAALQTAPSPTADPGVRARYEVSQRGDELAIHLTLVNVGAEPLSVLAKLGSRLGPQLSVHRVGAPDGELLAEVVKMDRGELVSRIGPRPTYADLVASGELDIGTYRFHAAEGRVDQIDVTLCVPHAAGVVELPTQRLAVGGKVGA